MAMWPDLFGPGWIWGVLIAAGLFGIFLALVWLFGDFHVPYEAPDPLQAIWHQHEHGELTRHEFDRAKRALDSSTFSPERVKERDSIWR